MAAKTFRQMTDNEFKAAAQQIVRTSASEDEVRQRIKNELGYPHGISITSHLPQDNTGRQARSIDRSCTRRFDPHERRHGHGYDAWSRWCNQSLTENNTARPVLTGSAQRGRDGKNRTMDSLHTLRGHGRGLVCSIRRGNA